MWATADGATARRERLAIGRECVLDPALLRIDGGQGAQCCHAATTVQRDGANRECALEKLLRPLAVPDGVVVEPDAIKTLRLVPGRLDTPGHGERAIEQAQRLIEVPQGIVRQRRVVVGAQINARVGIRREIGERTLEPVQGLRQASQAP